MFKSFACHSEARFIGEESVCACGGTADCSRGNPCFGMTRRKISNFARTDGGRGQTVSRSGYRDSPAFEVSLVIPTPDPSARNLLAAGSGTADSSRRNPRFGMTRRKICKLRQHGCPLVADAVPIDPVSLRFNGNLSCYGRCGLYRVHSGPGLLAHGEESGDWTIFPPENGKIWLNTGPDRVS